MRRLLSSLVVLLAAAMPSFGAAATFDIEYEASLLNVVTLGTLSLRGRATETVYGATGVVETAGAARLFEETRLTATSAGQVNGAEFSWASYALQHRYAKPGRTIKSRAVNMRRAGGAVSVQANPMWSNMGTPPSTPAQQSGSLDPVTALVSMSRAMGRAPTCAGRFQIFDGKQTYALSLSPKSASTFTGGGYSGTATICAMRYQQIAGFDPHESDAGAPQAEVWFGKATDGFAPILRIEVPTPVGAARMDVKRLALN